MFSTAFSFLNQGAPGATGPAPPAYEFLFSQLTGSPGYYGNFSLRKLNSAYTGNCIEIRRGSDNTTTNIGFANNVLDESAISSFCSGTTCYVKTWYDQSGLGNNFNQTTNSNQPIIYQSGAVETLNGKPAINFDGASGHHLLSPLGWLQYVDTFSYIHVGAVDNTAGSNAGVFGPYDTYLQGLEVLLHNVINIPTLVRLQGDDINDANATFFGDNVQTIMELYDSANLYAFSNGTDLTSSLLQSSWSGDFSYYGKHAMMMYAGTGNCASGKMQEWNIFDTSEYSQRTAIYNNIDAFYF